jgi:excisionase family DNA binding protein
MTHYYHNPNLLTGDEAAALLGVSRKTVYRWASEGRLSTPFTRSDIEARRPAVRPRGPRRNPHSLRYVAGRHSFSRKPADDPARAGAEA